MKCVVHNNTNATIVLPAVFNSHPLPANGTKDFLYKSIPVNDRKTLVSLATTKPSTPQNVFFGNSSIDFPGDAGIGIPAGLPLKNNNYPHIIDGQEPADAIAGDKVWSMTSNTEKTFNGVYWYSTSLSAWSFLPDKKYNSNLTCNIPLANNKVLNIATSSAPIGTFQFAPSKKAEVFDYDTLSWSDTGDLEKAHIFGAACQLDGGAFVCGGENTWSSNGLTNKTEVYSLSSNSWQTKDNSPQNLATGDGFGAVRLNDGRVMVCGLHFYNDDTIDTTPHAYIFDTNAAPASQWLTVASPPEARIFPSGILVLSDGRVMIVGGADTATLETTNNLMNSTNALIYNPHSYAIGAHNSNTWITTGNFPSTTEVERFTGNPITPNVGRARGGSALLPNGDVITVGGQVFDATASLFGVRKSTCIWHKDTNSWTAGPELFSEGPFNYKGGFNHAAVTLDSGKVLFFGGNTAYGFIVSTTKTYLYDHLSNTISLGAELPPMLVSGSGNVYTNVLGMPVPILSTIHINGGSAAKLGNGKVVVAGMSFISPNRPNIGVVAAGNGDENRRVALVYDHGSTIITSLPLNVSGRELTQQEKDQNTAYSEQVDGIPLAVPPFSDA